MTSTARPIETAVRKAELPPTYPAGRRCLRCGAFLNRYHEALAQLCYPCEPGGEGGVVIRVGPKEWRRFMPVERESIGEPFELELAELMERRPDVG